jgi:hypothetical protein
MRKATLPTLLVVLTTLTMGCEPRGNGEGESGRPVHCDIVADSPQVVKKTDQFTGVVRFRCGHPGAERLTLKIRVERQDGEKWHTVTTKDYTLNGLDSYAAELKYQSRDATAKCSTGVYRTVVSWSRASRGDTATGNQQSPTMRDPCRTPIFG